MTPATQEDRPAIEAFLHRHLAVSMFPLSNLAIHGMTGGHPRAVRFWLWWASGEITDVVTVSDAGMVFPVCPTGPWGEVATVFAGTSVNGAIGGADQVAAFRAAVGLTQTAALDAVEPHFTLSLSDLIVPDAAGLTLHPLQAAQFDLIVAWRAAFCIESLATPPADATDRATQEVSGYLERDSHRVLMDGDSPVAMTGFNAVLPQAVQIGGVYTPPAQRSCGYARLAVALHLLEARQAGVGRAVLSAANQAAVRAYEAIGFTRCGEFSIVAYDTPQVIYG